MKSGLRIVRSGIVALALAGTGLGTAQIVLASSAMADYGSVRATTAVNVRAGTSLSTTIVGVLYPGDTARQVGAAKSGWVPISFGGATRYVSSSYVSGASSGEMSSTTTSAPTTTTTTRPESTADSPASARRSVWATDDVNVRTGPSLNDAIVDVLATGRSTTATGTTSGPWTQVDFNGRIRWIYSSYLTTTDPSRTSSEPTSGSAPRPTTPSPTTPSPTTPTPPATHTTTMWATADVHIRTGPSLGDAIVGILSQGTSTTATGTTSGPWTQVDNNGQIRWIYSSYLTTAAPATGSTTKVVGFAVTTTALMIRTSSAATFVDLGDIPTGTIVALTGVKAPGVAQIVYHGTVRWVNSLYLVPVGATYTATGTPSSQATSAVAFALAQVGKKYAWGGTGPDAYDCSGLVLRAWERAGVWLPRTSQEQFQVGTGVATANLEPGDLIFYYWDASHVGIYIGNGQMVHAANPNQGVTIDPIGIMPIVGSKRVG